MTKQKAIVQTEDVDQDAVARWVRAEAAFQAVRLQGQSLRAVADELGVSVATVWRDVRAMEQFLARSASERDVKDVRAGIEALCHEALNQSRAIMQTNPGKPLVQVAALNSFIATISHLRAITGADVPRNKANELPGTVKVSWSNGDG
jgi:hypothetical protein